MSLRRSTLVTSGLISIAMIFGSVGPIHAAEANSPSAITASQSVSVDCGETYTASLDKNKAGNIVETLDDSMRVKLSDFLQKTGHSPLPASAVTLHTKPNADLVAYDAKGNLVETWSLSTLSGEESAELMSLRGPADWLKGAARAFAKSVVGCVSGVVGFDAVLSILEKRVSYWAFVKWLGGKVGWGLAVSCASGAATAVLGW
ncbi:hypothetical protein [Austwickia chelonae]|uniref:hypothetical protein n=1 Tax=Austwickia chelonae TaxID=100225 RepID=UPI0013C35736|nr:hypothetical protein [Austwickia chelonae]